MYLINIISKSRIYTHFKRMTLTTTTSTRNRIRTYEEKKYCKIRQKKKKKKDNLINFQILLKELQK